MHHWLAEQPLFWIKKNHRHRNQSVSSLTDQGGGHRAQVSRVLVQRAVLSPRPARMGGGGGSGGSSPASALRERQSQRLCRGWPRRQRVPPMAAGGRDGSPAGRPVLLACTRTRYRHGSPRGTVWPPTSDWLVPIPEHGGQQLRCLAFGQPRAGREAQLAQQGRLFLRGRVL